MVRAAHAAGPGFGEEEEAEFVHHIRIGHIEVVLEHRDGDETAELWGCAVAEEAAMTVR